MNRISVPKKIKKTALVIGVLLAIYSFVGFWGLPKSACLLINHFAPRYVTVPAHLESITLNPFTGELVLLNLKVGAPDQPLLGFSRLGIDLQIDSLWTRTLHLREVTLDNAQFKAQMFKDGKFNLASVLILPAADNKPDDKTKKSLFPLRIDEVNLQVAGLWQDERATQPLSISVEKLALKVQGLSTLGGEKGQWSMTGAASALGRVDAAGTLDIAAREFKGKLQLKECALQTLWPYAPMNFPVVLTKGMLSLGSDFSVVVAEKTQAKLDNAYLRLRSLEVKDTHDSTLLNLKKIDVEKVRLNLAKQQVKVGAVVVDGMEAPIVREAGGQLQWEQLAAKMSHTNGVIGAPAGSQAGSAAPATAPVATVAQAKNAGKPWMISAPSLQVKNADVNFVDNAVTPAQQLLLKDMQLSVTDFESSLHSPLGVALSAKTGEQGAFAVAGQINLSPVSAHLQVNSKDIDLRVAQAYLSPFVQIELRSGMLDSALQLELSTLDPLAFSVNGDVGVSQLHTLDAQKNQDFLKWQQLQLTGIHYQHGTRLAIDAVKMQMPYLRFVINENRSTNVQALLVKRDDKTAAASSAANITAPATPPVSMQPRPSLAIHIGGIDVMDGSANFADYSLTPNFSTVIGQLNGKIGTLDNQQDSPARIDIAGKVDRYAPVNIEGTLTPFDPLQRLDINARFHRMELTTLTPYSGKFAGYRIRKGRLNLDLHYQITQGQLNAQNNVVLDDLQLGEKVDSPDAVDLPVRLAVALLKDPEGNIKVELPVEGDLNNPSFSLGPVIWKTLRNLIVRAVESPFSFISGLVKGDSSENLDSIAFAPGSSELSAAGVSKLKTLSSALKERPRLRLEVEGTSARHTDGEPMAQQSLMTELRKAYKRVLQQQGKKLPADDTQLQVPDNDKPALLAGLYVTQLGKPVPPEWNALPAAKRDAQIQAAVVDHLGESERRLRQLARDRAAAIKGWLVESGGLPDQRIYLLNTQLRDDKSGESITTALYLSGE